MSELWGRLCSAVLKFEAQSLRVLDKGWLFDVLGKHVRRILSPEDLLEREVPGPHPVLHPEIGYGEAPYLPKTAASAYADRRGRISVHRQVLMQTEVTTQRSRPDPLACAFADP